MPKRPRSGASRRAMLLATLAALACLAPGAGAQDARRVNGYTQAHVLRYAVAEDIAGLNPMLVQQGATALLARLTMAWLFRYDRANRPLPELATVVPSEGNGGIAPDGKTITYHLRRNVRWSDGAPFDADDVVFSFAAMNNPANNIASRAGFDLVTRVDEPDKYTVVVRLKRPYASFIPVFFTTAGGNPALLPKHILGSLANINDAPYNELPVGIGPFRFTAWRRGDAVEMEANPQYWRGLPKLRKVVFRIVPDRNTVETELRTGELDLWYPVPGLYFVRLKGTNLRTIRQPSYLYNHIDLNLTRPVLQDRNVRAALRLALDRKTLRDKVALGVGVLQESVVPAPYPGVGKVPLVPFDVAKANALLERAGWLRGPDGIRRRDGVRLSIEFASSAGAPDVDEQLEIIRAGWQQIGVELNVKRYLSSQLFGPFASGGIYNSGKFDAIALAWGVAPTDDLTDAFSCGAFPPSGQNAMHYCNRALEPILADFSAHYDAARQAADLTKAATIISEDVPTIVTWSREDLFVYNADLTGFHPNNATPLDDMMGVDI